MIWTLAVRNVMRNCRRSVITVLSIAVGLAALTFLWGFIDGMNRQMINNTTRYFAADAQVHLKGYHDDPSLDRAIAAKPVIVLPDEPTANLDSQSGATLMDLMRRLNEEQGTTFVFSTHDPMVVERARRVIRLRDGRIEADERRPA